MKKKIYLFILALATIVFFAVSAQAQPPGAVQPKFTAALNSMQVVPANNSTGRANCVVTIFNPWVLDIVCEYSGLSSNLTRVTIRWARAGKNGPTICGVGSSGTDGTISFRCGLPYIPPATVLLPQKYFYVDFCTSNFPEGEIRGQIKPITLDSDIDGDGLMDAFIYRPFDACSYTLCSVNGSMMEHQFEGETTDSTPFLADFDGDGLADHSFIRTNPYTKEIITIYVQSKDNTVRQVQWGNATFGDQQAFGDYDNDGKIDNAVFRPSDGVWYILQSSNGQPRYEHWGLKGDRACPGDYDQDGKTDLCVVRDESGYLVWHIRRSSDNQYYAVNWGLSTDTIFPDSPIDIDADGANDILVMRAEREQRQFYALRSSDSAMFVLPWGLMSDSIRIGDFDGDGKTDFTAIRNIDKQLTWFVWQSADNKIRVIYWGKDGDL